MEAFWNLVVDVFSGLLVKLEILHSAFFGVIVALSMTILFVFGIRAICLTFRKYEWYKNFAAVIFSFEILFSVVFLSLTWGLESFFIYPFYNPYTSYEFFIFGGVGTIIFIPVFLLWNREFRSIKCELKFKEWKYI